PDTGTERIGVRDGVLSLRPQAVGTLVRTVERRVVLPDRGGLSPHEVGEWCAGKIERRGCTRYRPQYGNTARSAATTPYRENDHRCPHCHHTRTRSAARTVIGRGNALRRSALDSWASHVAAQAALDGREGE